MMCGLRPDPAECDADAHVDASVAFFLRAYATRPGL
jgi:TetR/AcrR family transcriptional repressor of mexJK operon